MRCLLTVPLVVLLAVLELSAQTPVQEAYPDNYPSALPSRKGAAPPRFVFDPVGEVSLPGPLPEGSPALVEGRLRVPVAGGTAWVVPAGGAEAMIDTAPIPSPEIGKTAGDAEAWVLSEAGRFRFRIDADGRIRAQRRSSWSRDGWRKAWTIRAVRALPTPPMVIGRRLYFTATDDRIYAVRTDNGHRLWAVDVGERASRPITRWSGTIPTIDPGTRRAGAGPLELLLVVPDSGGSLAAYDAYDGSLRGSFSLPAGSGWLTSPAVVLDEGRIAVARQGYEPTQAALALFRLRPPDTPLGPETRAAGKTRVRPL